MTKIADLIDKFAQMLYAERGSSHNTIDAYKRDVANLGDFFQDQAVETITESDLQRFTEKLTAEGYNVRSIARKISSIRHFFSFLLSEQIIDSNPMLHIHSPKIDQSIPKPMLESEIEQIISYIKTDNSPRFIRANCIIEMLYSTGMRVSELLSLTLQQAQNCLQSGKHDSTIIVRGKGNVERVVILNEDAVVALQRYMAIRQYFLQGERSDWLFPSRNDDGRIDKLTRQSCADILNKMAIKAGINPKYVSLHKIRHAFATHMLNKGADIQTVQNLLGHADISSTQIYTKIMKEKAEQTINLHPITQEAL